MVVALLLVAVALLLAVVALLLVVESNETPPACQWLKSDGFVSPPSPAKKFAGTGPTESPHARTSKATLMFAKAPQNNSIDGRVPLTKLNSWLGSRRNRDYLFLGSQNNLPQKLRSLDQLRLPPIPFLFLVSSYLPELVSLSNPFVFQLPGIELSLPLFYSHPPEPLPVLMPNVPFA